MRVEARLGVALTMLLFVVAACAAATQTALPAGGSSPGGTSAAAAPGQSVTVPETFPIDFTMITDNSNDPVWTAASFTTDADGSQHAAFVPLHHGQPGVSAADSVTTLASAFTSTTPVANGFAFDDGFGTGTVTTTGSSEIDVTYTPGAEPTVSLPADWPAAVVPAAGGTGVAWRATLVSVAADGTASVTFVPDRALSSSDLAAIATASTRALSPEPAPDGGIAIRSGGDRLGSWRIERGGFVVTLAPLVTPS